MHCPTKYLGISSAQQIPEEERPHVSEPPIPSARNKNMELQQELERPSLILYSYLRMPWLFGSKREITFTSKEWQIDPVRRTSDTVML